MANEKTPEPMGGDIPEDRNPQPQRQDLRNVWAIDVLIAEVTPLFDTGHYTKDPNWLAANMEVVFTPAEGEWEDMAILMQVVKDDERVESMTMDEEASTITVRMVSNAILYDTRDSFGLGFAVMGLDREITPDDMTPLASALASEEEGFIDSAPTFTPISPNDPNKDLIVEGFGTPDNGSDDDGIESL